MLSGQASHLSCGQGRPAIRTGCIAESMGTDGAEGVPQSARQTDWATPGTTYFPPMSVLPCPLDESSA